MVKSEGNGVVVWTPPNLGVYKLNTDATIDRASECVGFGLVLCDLEGFVVAVSSQKVTTTFAPQVTEVIAIRPRASFGL